MQVVDFNSLGVYTEPKSRVIDLDYKDRFYLPFNFKTELRSRPEEFGFGLLGAATYYRTYSRLKSDGTQERWADTVIRVVEGVMSIRKWWYLSNNITWDDEKWKQSAMQMATSIHKMEMMPPGRGLWAAGTDWMYEKGSAALYNCAYTESKTLSEDAAWTMDMLMCGVGVGFSTRFFGDQTYHKPLKNAVITYEIPDSREGWVESIRMLIESYEKKGSPKVEFDYSLIRPVGSPIRGFGGTASGHLPLKKLHRQLRLFLNRYVEGVISSTVLVANVMNAIGGCVVAGNVRRSAEIALGDPDDNDFVNLKNYGHAEYLYECAEHGEFHYHWRKWETPTPTVNCPECDEKAPAVMGEYGHESTYIKGPANARKRIGWMSNNSVVLDDYSDFNTAVDQDIIDNIRENGEPGYFNLKNIQKYGRYGEKSPDNATGANPCSEIPLEDAEVCNLVEVFPSRCVDESGKFSPEVFYNAVQLATLYASTISLLPTHSDRTNAVVERNRRIGVSLSGIAKWVTDTSWTECITWMDNGYKLVRQSNKKWNREAGVVDSIRVTTVKPSGTISLLAGVPAGMHLPPYSRYIRRVRVGQNTPIVPILQEAGVPYENDVVSENTFVFEFPVDLGKVKGQKDVSMWEKAQTVVLLQKFWADNMVSNTIDFDPYKEGEHLASLITHTLPFIKSMSLMPSYDYSKTYAQIPEEQITLEEVNRRKKEIKPINWNSFGGSDGQDSKFCSNDSCEV